MKEITDFQIRPARVDDVPIILQLIRDLATYERAPDEVTATEEQLVDVLFGERPAAEVLLAFEGNHRSGLQFTFTIFLPGSGDLDFISKICSLSRRNAAKVMVARCLSSLRRSRVIAAAAGWNGRCSIGMNRRSSFISALGAKPMDEWTVFRLTRDEIAKLADAADTAATTEPNKE